MFKKRIRKLVDDAMGPYLHRGIKLFAEGQKELSVLHRRLDEANELCLGLAGRLDELEAAYDNADGVWDEETARAEKDFIEGLSNLVNYDVKEGRQ